MQIDLRDKVAIITGAGRGIGREIAATLAAEGVKTVALDVQPQLLESISTDFQAKGWQGFQHHCDVRDSASVQSVVQRTLDAYGQIDILVNNAGVSRSGSVEFLSEEDWDLTMEVNLKGVFLMCKAVIPAMKSRRSGRIINAASFAAIIPSVNGSAYAASKAAVVYFTRTLAGELGPYNITVNSYAPGMIPTDINDFADADSERQNMLLDTLTLRRWGTPREVAELICFLASDQAGYITGALIDVSGGKLATQLPQMAYRESAANVAPKSD